MQVNLRINDVGKHFPAVFDDSRRRFVTGAFDRQYEHICISQAQSFFQGCDFLRFPEVYDSLTREDAQAMIARWVTPERTALSVVRPREEAVE